MALTLQQVLEYPSLQRAKLVAGSTNADTEVTGIMVMEAPDIEIWGRRGLLILTSYFAMMPMDPAKIDLFFRHAKRLGIAAFIVKVERLVQTIPTEFMQACDKYQIPLIQIDKNTTYEKIISDISESIINRNAFLLKNFYDVHTHFMRLMMSQPEILQVLETLETLIGKPVTLTESIRRKSLCTDPALAEYRLLEHKPLPRKPYFNIDIQQNTVEYAAFGEGHVYTQLSITIPNLGYEEYELLIHELGEPVSDLDFMAIENTVGALQMELLKRYAMRQNSRSRLNELASDLLHGRLTTDEDMEETIYQLDLDPACPYRVVLFQFETADKELDAYDPIFSRLTDTLIHYAGAIFPNRLYVTRKQKVIFIIPVKDMSRSHVTNSTSQLISRLERHEQFQEFNVHATISKESSLQDISKAYQQAFDTQKILTRMGNRLAVAAYEELGIYQLFVETENLEQLERFIPDVIWHLQRENPELLDTLSTFLNMNQNYSQTAERLFVHPKTVRYRVERLKEAYHINLDNAEESLRYSIAIRLLKLLPLKEAYVPNERGGDKIGTRKL